ncbi:MAG: DUF5320 domain-containing protein [Candidatus Altiarchaeota archaeon]|nr:DUF5320 domain-containing protein [Candidatus Altiarchaeota archaeon]
MPRGDKTGPDGKGPKTGRGLGMCAGSAEPGFKSSEQGRGMGRGFGMGRGRGFGREVKLSKEEQVKLLKSEKAAIEKKLKELE